MADSTQRNDVVQRDAQELAKGYKHGFRVIEVLSIATFCALALLSVWRLAPRAAQQWPILVYAFVAGWVGADFVSGFVHWLADTWGSADMAVIGPTLIRNFREHHVDPKAITRHDFVERNGANCLVSVPVLAAACFVPVRGGLGAFVAGSLLSLTSWVFLTNQIHMWAHRDENPWYVRWGQATRMILPVENHDVHHHAPFAKYYCITTGWLNWPLHQIGFFRGLERLVTRTTGAIPRADDIGKKAAIAVAEALSVTGDAGVAAELTTRLP